jgi:hypothetical protein
MMIDIRRNLYSAMVGWTNDILVCASYKGGQQINILASPFSKMPRIN